MAKSKDIHDPAAVTSYIESLEPALAELATEIRRIILSTDKKIGEQIKWNSPAFFYTGVMQPFDPKEYRRDLIVFNMRKGHVMLVFPTGATIQDTTGFMEGTYTDGRRMVTLKDLADVKAKHKALQTVIRAWLKLVE